MHGCELRGRTDLRPGNHSAERCLSKTDQTAMVVFLTIFSVAILITVALVIEFTQLEKKAVKEGFGPKTHVTGSLGAHGSLVCVNADAPTGGRHIRFPYEFEANYGRGDLSATYVYRGPPSRSAERIYEGDLFFRFKGNSVKGRTRMAGLKTIEGRVGQHQTALRYGYPSTSWLSFLSGAFEYSVNGGQVRFEKTEMSGSISNKSQLQIQGDRIAGRVLHGPQTTWAVEVDVVCNGIPAEQAALAVIMACNDIVAHHHD